MKKIIIFTVALLFASAGFAQKQSTDIKPTQLPDATLSYIKSNLPGCQITKATKVIEAGKVTYDVTVDVKGKKNLFIFDGAGGFLKRGNTAPQSEMTKPAPTGSDQKIIPVEDGKSIEQTGDKKVAQPSSQPTTAPATTKKIAQPESRGAQPSSQPKSTQQTAPQGVKSTGGGTKKVAQPVSTETSTKPAAQPATTQPASTGGVKPASSGAVQQTGSKDVKQTGSKDKKVAQPSGSGDLTKPK